LNAPIQWNSKGSGTDLIRSTQINGRTLKIKSGHGYNRPHITGDVSNIGTMDEIDYAIALDIQLTLASGINFPPITATPPYIERDIIVNGQSITYRALELPSSAIEVTTYFPTP